MAEERKKVRTNVNIYGEQYTIVGEEDQNYIRKVAKAVDERMRDIKDNNPYLDTKKLAVLTAVNAVNEYMKLQKQLEQDKEGHKKDEETR